MSYSEVVETRGKYAREAALEALKSHTEESVAA